LVDIEIRPALRTELEQVLGLYRSLEPGYRETTSLPVAEQIFDRFSQYPNYNLYVALVEGKIAGTFALLIMDNLAHYGAPSAIVEDVVVGAESRGQGIGKQMMQFAMQRCREAGCYKLALSSNQKRVDAHRFYESLGFQLHGYSYAIDLKGKQL